MSQAQDKIDSSPNYLLDRIEAVVSGAINHLTGETVDVSLSKAPQHTKADYGIQITQLAKTLGRSPLQLAQEIARRISEQNYAFIATTQAQGPYLNLRLAIDKVCAELIDRILRMGADYGKENIGKGKIVIIDMSSPNIAKRMSYGHLRSTIIGAALANLYSAMGFKTVKDNHIGDWGTQFGNLIAAIKRWGNEEKLVQSADPIGYLQNLYIRFHTEVNKAKAKMIAALRADIDTEGIESFPEIAEVVAATMQALMKRKGIAEAKMNRPQIIKDVLDKIVVVQLEDEGREWFKQLEKGNPEAKKLWKICVALSLKEFEEIYQKLGVDFDVVLGESFYENMLAGIIDEVRTSKVGKESGGALIVDMQDKNLGVAIVQKSDGSSVYMTRDLATAIYREKEMQADSAIYVVGEDQKLYFQQLFEILKRLGYKLGTKSTHVYFGMVNLPEGKMSTRRGRVVLLKQVIDQGYRKVAKLLQKKNPKLYNNRKLRDKVIAQIAIGALKWNDLAENPKRSIMFDWNKALSLEGYSAPYVQYTVVRANSILKKAGISEEILPASSNDITDSDLEEVEREVLITLAEYPKVLRNSIKYNDPSTVAKYAYAVAKLFNAFYNSVPVMRAPKAALVNLRLRLTAATAQVISNALDILGIEVPEAM